LVSGTVPLFYIAKLANVESSEAESRAALTPLWWLTRGKTMNRRKFLQLFGAGALATAAPTYFFAPRGGWVKNDSGIYVLEINGHAYRFQRDGGSHNLDFIGPTHLAMQFRRDAQIIHPPWSWVSTPPLPRGEDFRAYVKRAGKSHDAE
jgi:hypothetical protein